MKKIIGLTVFALMLAPLAHAGTTGLEGSVWNATLMDNGSSQQDTLVFVDGKFISTKCVPYGYGTSGYSAAAATEGTKWKAEQKSGKDKTMWNGTLKGNTMSGTFTHMTGDGSKTTQNWTATKAQ